MKKITAVLLVVCVTSEK